MRYSVPPLDRVVLHDLLAAGLVLYPHEAAALVREAARHLARRRPMQATADLTPDSISIRATGEVNIAADVALDDLVSRLGTLLDALVAPGWVFPAFRPRAGLISVIARARGEGQPPFESVEEFRAALAQFERGDATAVTRSLYDCARVMFSVGATPLAPIPPAGARPAIPRLRLVTSNRVDRTEPSPAAAAVVPTLVAVERRVESTPRLTPGSTSDERTEPAPGTLKGLPASHRKKVGRGLGWLTLASGLAGMLVYASLGNDTGVTELASRQNAPASVQASAAMEREFGPVPPAVAPKLQPRVDRPDRPLPPVTDEDSSRRPAAHKDLLRRPVDADATRMPAIVPAVMRHEPRSAVARPPLDGPAVRPAFLRVTQVIDRDAIKSERDDLA